MTRSGTTDSNSARPRNAPATGTSQGEPVFWRVEGSLLNLTAVRPVGFFSWNAQSFLERWARRGAMGALAVGRPLFYLTNRAFATRLLHMVLRGVSRDRLDLLGEEYFNYELKPRIKQRGYDKLKETIGSGARVVLVSQGLDHIMRPLAEYLNVREIICNRLDFHDGIATGRLLDPVIRPRGLFARFSGNAPDGSRPREQLLRDLKFRNQPDLLNRAIQPTRHLPPPVRPPVVHYNSDRAPGSLSVRSSLRGRNILLIGATGFIGKVWLANLLTDLPEIGRVYLLVRPHRSRTALERFQRLVEESPVFEPLAKRHGDSFAEFLSQRVEVIAGDVTQPGLGLPPEIQRKLAGELDVVVNSAGLTAFNPDLRDALATNVRATANLLDFLRECDRAALLHLSTCYVAGRRDGRILETLPKNYTPLGKPGFDAHSEWQRLETVVRETQARAESQELAEELRHAALGKEHAAKHLQGSALDNQIRKNRLRWLRQTLTNIGMERAGEFGWPNTYTFTKSLA
ncbi:MAG TPA: SDR family oxidoreductase [Candidatus Acidoferrales bacterium]|nr:SDR family oxidoreductase [Candidatus Acidoferrales bacterium]